MGSTHPPWVWRTPKSLFWAGVVIPPVWCAWVAPKNSSAYAPATTRYPPLRVHVRVSSLSTVLRADRTGGWREGHGHGVGWSPFLSKNLGICLCASRTGHGSTMHHAPHIQAHGGRALNALAHSPTHVHTCRARACTQNNARVWLLLLCQVRK